MKLTRAKPENEIQESKKYAHSTLQESRDCIYSILCESRKRYIGETQVDQLTPESPNTYGI
jgi:hypothetical protein